MPYLLTFSMYMKGLTIKSTAWKPGRPPVPEELFQTIQVAQWLGLAIYHIEDYQLFFIVSLRQSCVVLLNLELLLYHLLRLMISSSSLALTPPTKDLSSILGLTKIAQKHPTKKEAQALENKLDLSTKAETLQGPFCGYRLLETGQPSSPPDCKSFRDSRLQLSWSH